MESMMARALEFTLKYWLKSFTRDQFKLQGRTVQLSNLELSGDALHASLGLPPALTVSMAKTGKLEILLPYLSNVHLEPIVVQIDKLDIVLEENDDADSRRSSSSAQTSSNSLKGGGYGFSEKIADGMTLHIQTVNLLVDTHGGGRPIGGATWASPMASITIRNLVLYTTNENWQVVNLKAARDFSDKNFIYVFRKLEWEYLCIDLLPHPDMLADVSEGSPGKKDEDDGAKRKFFGGERFIDGISGEAYITIQRTDSNRPLGLEVQVHITEAVCQALSEPGLRALLRFFTGLYVCLNREDVNPNSQQLSAEAAGRTLISFMVDHIFLGIKDAGFQLELLMQSLFFSRTSNSDGAVGKYLTRLMIGGLILRDTFSCPPCPLVQPSMQDTSEELLQIPEFGKNFCPPIYPLGDQQWRQNDRAPLMSLHCIRFMPALSPPSFSSQTVIDCKPLMIDLQEESCLRLASFIADGIIVNPSDIIPEISINSFKFNIKELDITLPLDPKNPKHTSFKGARLHIENLYFSESPSLKLSLLNLDMDAACYSMWDGQPIDASQRKWTAGTSYVCLSLETSENVTRCDGSCSDLWRCVEMKSVCVQVAMVTADGEPLRNVPPPGGVVRVSVACENFMSNTSVEQLFFVLDLYSHFGNISDKMANVGKNKRITKNENENENSDNITFRENVPADAAISVTLKNLKLTFLESSEINIQGTPLVQFTGDDLSLQVSHRTLGAAMAISSTVRWEKVQVDCACAASGTSPPGGTEWRAVFWVQNGKTIKTIRNKSSTPFLSLSIVHVVPYDVGDTDFHSIRVVACISGVRLAGGMNYNEALLHRFGILGPDGGPGVGLSRGLERLSSGPLWKLFEASPPFVNEARESQNENIGDEKKLGAPSDVNISVELKDWLFALESAEEMAGNRTYSENSYKQEEISWHTCFDSFKVKANGSKINGQHKYPVEVVRVGVEGLKTLKPQQMQTKTVEPHSGIDLEIDLVPLPSVDGIITWAVENLKFSAKQPIEVVVKKDELQHVTHLCQLEADSMGRMTVGILRLLKLDASVGQAALDQLTHLGSDGFEEIFSPRKHNKPTNYFDHGQSSLAPSDSSSLDSTLTSLESTLLDSQSNCATLLTELNTSNQHIHNVQQLAQKLESMQKLLIKLRDNVPKGF